MMFATRSVIYQTYIILIIQKVLVRAEDVNKVSQEDCSMNEKFENGKCKECPICKPGFGLKGSCGFGHGANLTCEPCEPGTYNKEVNDNQCVPCTACKQHYNRYEEYKCRPTIDAECGICLPGFFNSYRDAIQKEYLYPCTTCRLRPDDPDCKPRTTTSTSTTQSPDYFIDPVTPAGKPRDEREILHKSRAPPSHQSHSSASAQSNFGGETPTSEKGSSTDTNGAVLKAVLGTTVSLLGLMSIVLLLWKRKYVVRFCNKNKGPNQSDTQPKNGNGLPPPGTSIPMETLQLLEVSRSDVEGVPTATTRLTMPDEEHYFASANRPVANLYIPTTALPIQPSSHVTERSPDSAYESNAGDRLVTSPEQNDYRNPGDTFRISGRSSPSSDNVEMRSNEPNNMFGPPTLQAEGRTDHSSQNGGPASMSTPVPSSSQNGVPATQITNATKKPTYVFNGPTTVKIGSHEVGQGQTVGHGQTFRQYSNPDQEAETVNEHRLPNTEQPRFISPHSEPSQTNYIVPTQPEEMSSEAKYIG